MTSNPPQSPLWKDMFGYAQIPTRSYLLTPPTFSSVLIKRLEPTFPQIFLNQGSPYLDIKPNFCLHPPSQFKKFSLYPFSGQIHITKTPTFRTTWARVWSRIHFSVLFPSTWMHSDSTQVCSDSVPIVVLYYTYIVRRTRLMGTGQTEWESSSILTSFGPKSTTGSSTRLLRVVDEGKDEKSIYDWRHTGLTNLKTDWLTGLAGLHEERGRRPLNKLSS